MADPIQRFSSIPLPPQQLESGQYDPLPLESPRFQQKTADVKAETTDDVRRDDFGSYLDQQSISTLKRIQADTIFDPAADIQSSSVYQGVGDTKIS